MRGLGLLLFAATATADTSAPRPALPISLPWDQRCFALLDGKRRSWALDHPGFEGAYVQISQVNGGEQAVQLHTISRRAGFWILVHEQPIHPLADDQMTGFAGWEPLRTFRPINYPAIVRHLHPRSARMQAEPWVSRADWDAFRKAWQPLVDACLRDHDPN